MHNTFSPYLIDLSKHCKNSVVYNSLCKIVSNTLQQVQLDQNVLITLKIEI